MSLEIDDLEEMEDSGPSFGLKGSILSLEKDSSSELDMIGLAGLHLLRLEFLNLKTLVGEQIRMIFFCIFFYFF